MEVLLRSLYGATAIMAVPRRPHCGLDQPRLHCGCFEHVQSFRRAPAKVRGFGSFQRCYTAINDGNTAEPRRSWRCHCGLYRTSTAVAPRLRCNAGINNVPLLVTHLTEVEPPRDRRMVASLLFHDCTVVVLRWHGGDGGATAVRVRCHGGHGGAAATPLRIGPTALALRKF